MCRETRIRQRVAALSLTCRSSRARYRDAPTLNAKQPKPGQHRTNVGLLDAKILHPTDRITKGLDYRDSDVTDDVLCASEDRHNTLTVCLQYFTPLYYAKSDRLVG